MPPACRAAAFECSGCNYEITVANESNRVTDPTACPSCKRRWTFVLQHNHGIYADKQLVKMQESPNDIPEGETPQVGRVGERECWEGAGAGGRVLGTARPLPTRLPARHVQALP